MKEPQIYSYSKYSFHKTIGNFLMSGLVVTLFLFGIFSLLGNVCVEWELEFDQKLFVTGFLWMLIFINEVGIAAMPGKQNLARFLMQITCFLGMGIYIGLHFEDIEAGLMQLSEQAIDIRTFQEVEYGTDEVGTVLVLAVLFVGINGLMISFALHNLTGCILLPVCFMAFELALNVAPQGKELLATVMGTLLCHSGTMGGTEVALKRVHVSRKTRIRQVFHRLLIRLLCVLATLVTMLFVSAAFGGTVDYLLDRKEELREKQNSLFGNLEDKINEALGFKKESIGTSNVFDNRVDNQRPKYNNQTVMTVLCESYPKGNIYIKNTDREIYDSGKWKNGDIGSSLEKRMQELTYQRYTQIVGEESALYYRIASADSSGLFVGHLYNYTELEGVGIEKAICYDSVDDAFLSIITHHLIRDTKSLEYYELEDYADEVKSLTWNVAISNEAINELLKEVYKTKHYEMMYNLSNDMANKRDKSSLNTMRLYAGLAVQEALSNYEYSLDLDELPEGQDAVEYFLLESKTGYCMHFATAAVMALRRMGVPARYVNGYIVKPSDFSLTEKKEYVAEVLDNQAHAWVEIYFEDVGWMPLEATTGYSHSANVPMDTQNTESQSQTQSQTEKPVESQTESESQSQSESQSENSESQTSATVTQEETQKEEEKAASAGKKNVWPVILGIVAGLLCLGAVGFVLYKKKADKDILSGQLKKRFYGIAVCHMNYNLYRKLKRRGRAHKHMTDREYEQALARTFTDFAPKEWAYYMSIVKKAAFSREEISEEEVGFVRSIYTHKRRKR